MNTKDILKQIGLTDNETKAYLANLEYGLLPASILAKRVGLNRATTYSVLKTLIQKGLISQTKKPEGTYFNAKEPKSILKFLEDQKKLIDRKKELLEENIHLLKPKITSKLSKPNVTFFEGISGIKQIHEDIINEVENDTILEFIPDNMTIGETNQYILSEFSQKRINNKIFAKIIVPESEIAHQIRNEDRSKMRETRIIPKDLYNFESEITIYGKKIAMISYKQDEMIGLIVESVSITDTLKKIFQIVWNTSSVFVLDQKNLFS